MTTWSSWAWRYKCAISRAASYLLSLESWIWKQLNAKDISSLPAFPADYVSFRGPSHRFGVADCRPVTLRTSTLFNLPLPPPGYREI
jgi:hypothetical protein